MQEPTIGRIVTYRNRSGVDMPAIITALTDDPEYVHLQLFVPPGASPDVLSYQHGTARAESGEPDELLAGCWRWPERKQPIAVEIDLRDEQAALAEATRTASAAAMKPRAKRSEADDDQGA